MSFILYNLNAVYHHYILALLANAFHYSLGWRVVRNIKTEQKGLLIKKLMKKLPIHGAK